MCIDVGALTTLYTYSSFSINSANFSSKDIIILDWNQKVLLGELSPHHSSKVLERTTYRITGFFCGCKFLWFISKIGTCNFCNFIFCDFTPWHSDFYSLCQPDTPRFLSWACAFTLKSHSFSALLNTSIDHPSRNTCVLFLWTKANWSRNYPAVGSHSSWFELRKLGSCVFYHGIKRGCSLSSPCLYQWKQCTSNYIETN